MVDFTVCLDGKVPQQFYFLIFFYAFGGMLIPFVTALNSIFLAHLAMYGPPNNIVPLFIFGLWKRGQLYKICCTVSSWLPHILLLDDTFWFLILAFTAFVLSARSWGAKISPSVSFFSSPVLIQFKGTPDKSFVSFLNSHAVAFQTSPQFFPLDPFLVLLWCFNFINILPLPCKLMYM